MCYRTSKRSFGFECSERRSACCPPINRITNNSTIANVNIKVRLTWRSQQGTRHTQCDSSQKRIGYLQGRRALAPGAVSKLRRQSNHRVRGQVTGGSRIPRRLKFEGVIMARAWPATIFSPGSSAFQKHDTFQRKCTCSRQTMSPEPPHSSRSVPAPPRPPSN